MHTTDLSAVALAKADVPLSSDERLREVAAILARGVLRLRQAAPTSPGSRSSRTVENLSKQRQNGLDEGAETSPHVLAR